MSIKYVHDSLDRAAWLRVDTRWLESALAEGCGHLVACWRDRNQIDLENSHRPRVIHHSLSLCEHGIVTKRNARLGEAVRPQQRLFSIIAPEHQLVLARFPDGSSVPGAGARATLVPRSERGSAPCGAVVERS